MSEKKNVQFQSTMMTIIRDVAAGNETTARPAMAEFIDLYGVPMKNYLIRRFQLQEGDADDLLNEFMIAKILKSGAKGNLAKRFLERKHEVKNMSFRSYLLKSLVFFALDSLRSAKKDVNLDDFVNFPSQDEYSDAVDNLFETEWAARILKNAVDAIEQECIEKNQQVHWAVFNERVLIPTFHGCRAPDLEEVANLHGIKDAKTASNMLITIRNKFRRKVMQLIANYLPCMPSDSDELIHEELADLKRIAATLRYDVTVENHESSESLSLWELVSDEEQPLPVLSVDDCQQIWADMQAKRTDEFVQEVAPHLASMFAEVTIWGGHPLDRVREVWTHPSPPEILLQAIKSFAKKHGRSNDNAGYPNEIHIVLYHLSIATAWLRHETRITRDSPTVILKRLPSILGYDWLDVNTRNLLEEWKTQLSA